MACLKCWEAPRCVAARAQGLVSSSAPIASRKNGRSHAHDMVSRLQLADASLRRGILKPLLIQATKARNRTGQP